MTGTTTMADERQDADDVVTVQRWMTLDLWVALGEDPALFEILYDEKGFGDMWSLCLAIVRGTRDVCASNPPTG